MEEEEEAWEEDKENEKEEEEEEDDDHTDSEDDGNNRNKNKNKNKNKSKSKTNSFHDGHPTFITNSRPNHVSDQALLEALAKCGLVGRTVLANYPYIHPAVITSIATRAGRLSESDPLHADLSSPYSTHSIQWNSSSDVDLFRKDVDSIASVLPSKYGIDLGRGEDAIRVLATVRLCKGVILHSDGTYERTLGREMQVPLQLLAERVHGLKKRSGSKGEEGERERNEGKEKNEEAVRQISLTPIYCWKVAEMRRAKEEGGGGKVGRGGSSEAIHERLLDSTVMNLKAIDPSELEQAHLLRSQGSTRSRKHGHTDKYSSESSSHSFLSSPSPPSFLHTRNPMTSSPPTNFMDMDVEDDLIRFREAQLSVKGAKAIYVGPEYFGCEVTILSAAAAATHANANANAKSHWHSTAKAAAAPLLLHVEVRDSTQKDRQDALKARRLMRDEIEAVERQYFSLRYLIQRMPCNFYVDSRILGKLMGAVWVNHNDDLGRKRMDLGLGLRSRNGGNFYVPGFSRIVKTDDGEVNWEYRPEAAQVCAEYLEKFPWVYNALARQGDTKSRDIALVEVFPTLTGQERYRKLLEVSTWLKKESRLASHQLVEESVQVAPVDGILRVYRAVGSNNSNSANRSNRSNTTPNDGYTSNTSSRKVVLSNVSAAMLLAPCAISPAAVAADQGAAAAAAGSIMHEEQLQSRCLGERVICVAADQEVPFGSKGTIVGYFPGPEVCTLVIDGDADLKRYSLSSSCLISLAGHSSQRPSSFLSPTAAAAAAAAARAAVATNRDHIKEPFSNVASAAAARTISVDRSLSTSNMTYVTVKEKGASADSDKRHKPRDSNDKVIVKIGVDKEVLTQNVVVQNVATSSSSASSKRMTSATTENQTTVATEKKRTEEKKTEEKRTIVSRPPLPSPSSTLLASLKSDRNASRENKNEMKKEEMDDASIAETKSAAAAATAALAAVAILAKTPTSKSIANVSDAKTPLSSSSSMSSVVPASESKGPEILISSHLLRSQERLAQRLQSAQALKKKPEEKEQTMDAKEEEDETREDEVKKGEVKQDDGKSRMGESNREREVVTENASEEKTKEGTAIQRHAITAIDFASSSATVFMSPPPAQTSSTPNPATGPIAINKGAVKGVRTSALDNMLKKMTKSVGEKATVKQATVQEKEERVNIQRNEAEGGKADIEEKDENRKKKDQKDAEKEKANEPTTINDTTAAPSSFSTTTTRVAGNRDNNQRYFSYSRPYNKAPATSSVNVRSDDTKVIIPTTVHRVIHPVSTLTSSASSPLQENVTVVAAPAQPMMPPPPSSHLMQSTFGKKNLAVSKRVESPNNGNNDHDGKKSDDHDATIVADITPLDTNSGDLPKMNESALKPAPEDVTSYSINLKRSKRRENENSRAIDINELENANAKDKHNSNATNNKKNSNSTSSNRSSVSAVTIKRVYMTQAQFEEYEKNKHLITL